MWRRFTKSGLQLESVLQEPLRTDVCKTWVSAVAFLVPSHSWTTDSVRSVSPGLNTKRTGLLLSGPKLCSLHFLWKSRFQSLEEERRGTESTLLEVQCKVSTVSDGLGCHVICWCWSTVFSEVQGQHSRIPGSCRALPAADQLYGDADFIFQQDLAPAHSAKATSTWFKDHGIPVLNWPANSPDLNPIENLWGIVKRKMRYARPNNAEELKAAIRATWALITPEQCHRLIHSMPSRIAAVIQAKGAPTKYWVLYMLILFMFILFSWPRFLKILSLYRS